MIDIILSFDIEFSIGGAFSEPNKYKPLGNDYVWLNNDGESLGLGYILEKLSYYKIKGVFFIEACNTAYHGLNEMGDISKKIVEEGHDVQLHIHPGWLHYSNLNSWPKNDSCAGRTLNELDQIFNHGIEVFKEWGNKHPVAVRTGSLRVDDNYYRALSSSSIECSSSIGMSIYKPASPDFQIYAGVKYIYEKPELPITTTMSNIGNKKITKSLQILSCSLSEIIETIEQAEKNNISPVIILSHPFEFVRARNFRYEKYIKNNLIRRRLEGLCEYLSKNNNRYRVTTFSDLIDNNRPISPEQSAPSIKPMTAIKRMIENKLTDASLKIRLFMP